MPDQDGARIDARALLSGQERLEIQGRPVLLSSSFVFAVCGSVCAQRFAPPRTTKNVPNWLADSIHGIQEPVQNKSVSNWLAVAPNWLEAFRTGLF